MTGLGGGGAVEALVLQPPQPHVVAHDVQHPHHLAEDQHPAGDEGIQYMISGSLSMSGTYTTWLKIAPCWIPC